MCSIFSAGFREIPPVSKVIVFPTSTTGRVVFFLGSVVFKDDELGRLLAPARHAEQRTHPQTLHLFLFENLDRDPFSFGDGLRFVGDPGGGQDVRGVITEIADKDGGLCRGDAAPDPFGHLPRLSLHRDQNLISSTSALRRLRFDRR